LKRRFPAVWQRARTARLGLALLPRLFGYHERHCNLCGYRGKFLAEIHFPDIFTYDAVCPRCGSLPRNRLLCRGIDEKKLISPSDRLLHFAPEAVIRELVRGQVAEYVTTDINPAGVDVAENIEQLSFPNDRWDAIICSHVLEHVDHHKALHALYRVLAPGGRLMAFFPVVEGWERHYENPTVHSKRDRGVHYGKDNHLRRFGREIRDDFAAAGFSVECFTADGRTAVELGLIPGETLFIGRKA
jgi:SAM-dependent methyltransferase